MKILGIIPARFSSTRLPGKPLADIAGKPMIQRVYERAHISLPEIVVATDDERIHDTVVKFGGKAVMTSPAHNTGTNRCLEAYHAYTQESGKTFDVIVNVQGDEPLLEPGLLASLTAVFEDRKVEMSTLATPVRSARDLHDDTLAFVVIDADKNAMYFSRSPIPHVRGVKKEEWMKHHQYLKHIGMYAYTPKALEEFASMPMSELEKAESLEQLRWLQDGRKMQVVITEHEGISVDTEEDLARVRELLK